MNPAYGGTQSALALHDRRAHSLQSKATKACLEEIWREVDMASVTSRHPGRPDRPTSNDLRDAPVHANPGAGR